jgi:hypothetical protein
MLVQLAVFKPRLDGSAGTECIRAGRDGTLQRWPVLKRINGGGQSCPPLIDEIPLR